MHRNMILTRMKISRNSHGIGDDRRLAVVTVAETARESEARIGGGHAKQEELYISFFFFFLFLFG